MIHLSGRCCNSVNRFTHLCTGYWVSCKCQNAFFPENPDTGKSDIIIHGPSCWQRNANIDLAARSLTKLLSSLSHEAHWCLHGNFMRTLKQDIGGWNVIFKAALRHKHPRVMDIWQWKRYNSDVENKYKLELHFSSLLFKKWGIRSPAGLHYSSWKGLKALSSTVRYLESGTICVIFAFVWHSIQIKMWRRFHGQVGPVSSSFHDKFSR